MQPHNLPIPVDTNIDIMTEQTLFRFENALESLGDKIMETRSRVYQLRDLAVGVFLVGSALFVATKIGQRLYLRLR